jgi:hypothetical protein
VDWLKKEQATIYTGWVGYHKYPASMIGKGLIEGRL